MNDGNRGVLKDVASKAGVSIRTVNRALKASGYVSADVRARVLAAAEELSYQPNMTARALRMGRSDVIAAILPSTDELHIAKLNAFESTVRAGGYVGLAVFIDGHAKAGVALPASLTQRRPAGLAIFPGLLADARALIHREAMNVDAADVYVDASPDEELDAVRIDRPRGVRDAIRHFIAEGRGRIAYLGPDDPTRLEGYRSAMAEAGLEPIHVRQYDERRGDVAALLELNPRPDAVQVYSDVLAIRLLGELQNRGMRVPDDMAVIGFDNRDFASLSNPPLTTVAQPNREVGEAAAQILLDKISGRTAPTAGWSRVIPTTLIKRQSA